MAAPCTHVVGLRATFSVAITFCLLSDDSALATGLNAASATSLNLLSTSCNLDLWPPKLRSWSFPALAHIEHLCQFALKSVTSLLKYCVYKFDNRRTKSVVYVDIECVQGMIWTWQKCKQHCFSRIDYLSVRTKIRCFFGWILCVCVLSYFFLAEVAVACYITACIAYSIFPFYEICLNKFVSYHWWWYLMDFQYQQLVAHQCL